MFHCCIISKDFEHHDVAKPADRSPQSYRCPARAQPEPPCTSIERAHSYPQQRQVQTSDQKNEFKDHLPGFGCWGVPGIVRCRVRYHGRGRGVRGGFQRRVGGRRIFAGLSAEARRYAQGNFYPGRRRMTTTTETAEATEMTGTGCNTTGVIRLWLQVASANHSICLED